MTLLKTLGFIAATLLALRLSDFLLNLLSKPSDVLVVAGVLGFVTVVFLYVYFVGFVLRRKKGV